MNTRKGEIVDLKHFHLNAMLSLRKTTHEFHHEKLPDVFSGSFDENKIWREMRAYLPRLDIFYRRLRFGIGWEIAEHLVGYLLYFDYKIPAGKGEKKWGRVISDVAVAKSHQRSGIATAMLDEVRNRAQKQNVCMLYAHVWEGNEASDKLFSEAGFNIQMKYFYLPVGNELADAVDQ